MRVKKQQLEPYIERLMGSKLGKEYDKAVYYHPVYLTFMCQWYRTCLPMQKTVRDVTFIPGSRRYSAEEHGNPFQHSCMENPMDRRTWWAIVHKVAKN